MLFAIYGSPTPSIREMLWRDLSSLAHSNTSPWMLTGDFSATLSIGERQGGGRRQVQGNKSFQDFFITNHLFDLGFSRPMFTWRRGTLLVRLDRSLANEPWLTMFPMPQFSISQKWEVIIAPS